MAVKGSTRDVGPGATHTCRNHARVILDVGPLLRYDSVVARHPTPEERDEPVAVPLDPEDFLKGLLAAGPYPGDEEPQPEPPKAKPKTKKAPDA